MVPCNNVALSESAVVNVFKTIPANTKETPEWGNKVSPRYLTTVEGAFMIFEPSSAPPIFPMARERIYANVNILPRLLL